MGGNMSFNPYNLKMGGGISNTLMGHNNGATHNDNSNHTKMSNNEAFLAFLQKNDDSCNSDQE